MNSVGGAMGALYGTLFLKLAQETAGKTDIKLGDVVRMFQTAEKGILDIGKAQLGDKTLVDTLSPAVRSLEESEKNTILRALEQTGGIQKEAAEVLGISRRAIHYKIKKYGIDAGSIKARH